MTPARVFTIVVAPSGPDWSVVVERADTAWKSASRLMLKRAVAGSIRSFPLCPPAEAPDATVLTGAAQEAARLTQDPAAIAQLFDRIALRAQRQQSVEVMGRYLFEVLLGTAIWNQIREQARGAGLVELALQGGSRDHDLQRLNWEVMHSGAEFLSRGATDAGGKPFRIVITRVVPLPASADPTVPLRLLGSLPRILYVVGAALNDREIQAGAEYFGLFRQLRSEAGKGKRWRHLPTKVLVRASARRMEEAMKEFRPDIVHFICHGAVRQGRGVLTFAPDLAHPTDPTEFRADAIFERLQPDNDSTLLPAIVVLSACFSGGGPVGPQPSSLGGPEQSSPLALELVERGIPVVVAMAGAVADNACRLFTRTFGASLIYGQSLLEATERARRGALMVGAQPQQTLDWAMPVLFRAQNVPPNYGPALSAAQDDPETILRDVIDGLELDRDRQPPLAAHEEELDVRYPTLMNSSTPVLFVTGPRESGKSRFLRELALLAIYDGHIPVLVTSKNPEIEFRDMVRLREVLRLAVEQTANVLKIDTGLKTTLLVLEAEMDWLNPPAELPERLRKELKAAKALTGRALLLALQDELLTLADLARRQGKIRAGTGRVLLLIDQLDYMPVPFLDDVFASQNRRVVGFHGLGIDSATFLPVVMAAGLEGTNARFLRQERDTGISSGDKWFTALDLMPFPLDRDEDVMAFRRVLLQPFDDQILDGSSGAAWVWNPEAPSQDQEKWKSNLRSWLKRRVPGDFRAEILYTWAEGAAGRNVLRRADDNDLLAQLDLP